jgi:hypothetical protein
MLTTKKSKLLSDQYDNWSDIFAETIAPIAPEPTQKPLATASTFVCATPRLAHRALQTLWQTRMQMCSGTRPRPQVLPFHQPARNNAGHGLCSTEGSRHGRSIPRELSLGPRNPRSNLQHQSRTASSQGASIEKLCVHRKLYILGCSSDRSPPGGHPHCQHARTFVLSKILSQFSQGSKK